MGFSRNYGSEDNIVHTRSPNLANLLGRRIFRYAQFPRRRNKRNCNIFIIEGCLAAASVGLSVRGDVDVKISWKQTSKRSAGMVRIIYGKLWRYATAADELHFAIGCFKARST